MITVNDLNLAGSDLSLTFFASCMNVADDIFVFAYQHIGSAQIVRFEFEEAFYEVVFDTVGRDEIFSVYEVDDYDSSRNVVSEICEQQSFDMSMTIYEQVINEILSRPSIEYKVATAGCGGLN